MSPTVTPDPTETVISTTETPELEAAGTPSATGTPTEEPAIPFEPEVTCATAEGAQPPVAGDASWALIECWLSWDTEDVSRLEASLDSLSVPGWDILLLDPDDRHQPDRVAMHPQPLTLRPDSSRGNQFTRSTFFLGSRLSCGAPTGAELSIRFTATSGESTVEDVTKTLTVTGHLPQPPEVQLLSAEFEAVDTSEGPKSSTGVITLSYHAGSSSCGWYVTTTINDFISEQGVIPTNALTLIEATGVPNATSSHDNGVITLHVPPSDGAATSGTITIMVSIPMPQTVAEAEYRSTITTTSGIP